MVRQVKSWVRVVRHGETPETAADGPSEPSLAEVLLLSATIFTVHLVTVSCVTRFWEVIPCALDNPSYLEIARIIRHWHCPRPFDDPHFWGLPYALAGISKLFLISEPVALVLISMLASLAACVLVHRLYGGWVAMVFIFLNFQWIQLSVEGGSEPLFACLLYASFLAARSGRWSLAAALASLSTTVRPVGVFALVSFAAVLAWRKRYRQLAVITLIGLTVGVFYLLPLRTLAGNLFVNFTGYREDWGPTGNGCPLTYPFGALVPSYLLSLHSNNRWYMLVFYSAWLVGGCLGIAAVWLPRNRRWFSSHPSEALFASIYALFLLSYNYRDIAWFIPRFFIPVLPLLLYSLRDWIPRKRRLLWELALLSALVASAFTAVKWF